MENSVVIKVTGSQVLSAPVMFAEDAELRVEVSKADLFHDLDISVLSGEQQSILMHDLMYTAARNYIKNKCRNSDYGIDLFDEFEADDDFCGDLDDILDAEFMIIDNFEHLQDKLDNLFDDYKDKCGMKYFEVNADVTMISTITVYVKAKSREDAEDFVADMDDYDLRNMIEDYEIQDVSSVDAYEQSYDESEDYYEA